MNWSNSAMNSKKRRSRGRRKASVVSATLAGGVGWGLVCCLGVALAASAALGEENLARKSKLTPKRSLTAAPYRLSHVTDGQATGNANPQACESCWAGDNTDLRDDPLDFIVDFGTERVVDRIVLTTCRLKGQQRLTDFDVYGWAGTDWDGRWRSSARAARFAWSAGSLRWQPRSSASGSWTMSERSTTSRT
jgi:hypothetical protein